MDNLRMRLLDEVIDHLQGMQASDLKELLQEIEQKPEGGMPMEKESSEIVIGEPDGEMGMEKKPNPDEPTDDELEELMKRHK